MAWTEITRPKYRREGLRYASDTTDEEWALIEPHLPRRPAVGGRGRSDLRDAVNAIYYIAQSGCQWRMLQRDFPPYSTVQRYFYDWRNRGIWQAINHVLLMEVREAAGREASPTRRSDRQPVGQRRPRSGGPRGYDRQEDQRPQAAYPHRYNWPAGRDDCASSGYSGSRRCTPALLARVRNSFPWLRRGRGRWLRR